MINNIYQLNNFFLAGPHPGYNPNNALHPIYGLDKIIPFLVGRNGINRFIDLSDTHDEIKFNLEVYRPFLDDISDKYKIRLNYDRFSFPDMSVANDEFISKILDHIYNSIDNGDKIYLHCVAGLGRTGLIVGCYMKENGIKDAIGEMYKLRYKSLYRSPLTYEQYEKVLNWNRKREIK